IVLVEVVINLDDAVVHAIGKRSRDGDIAPTIGVAIYIGIRRSGPGIEGEQFLNHGIDSSGGRDIRRGRNTSRAAFGASFTHTLVVDEEEGAVMDDGSADVAAELVQVKGLLWADGG